MEILDLVMFEALHGVGISSFLHGITSKLAGTIMYTFFGGDVLALKKAVVVSTFRTVTLFVVRLYPQA